MRRQRRTIKEVLADTSYLSLVLAIAGLVGLVACVSFEVFVRPTLHVAVAGTGALQFEEGKAAHAFIKVSPRLRLEWTLEPRYRYDGTLTYDQTLLVETYDGHSWYAAPSEVSPQTMVEELNQIEAVR